MFIFLNFVIILGYDLIFMGVVIIFDIVVCGVMFGYFLKIRNKE